MSSTVENVSLSTVESVEHFTLLFLYKDTVLNRIVLIWLLFLLYT